ncbi:hypothetical protein NQ314_004581 [Rhamnusium bicolor]|uniref:Uncharacterized protein n=1 Tax=Rhamnusium bicolor TaxID=1586634 RepID=A0AAV8ZLX0_9CUCU|nr:hypothetical protein NQ314_004581 [Rhamnusium bicolor]
MSQLPRPGCSKPAPKVVKSTSTKTVNVPGTNQTITQTQTTVIEVQPCPSDGSGIGRGRPGGTPRGLGGGKCPPPSPCGTGGSAAKKIPSGIGRGLRPPGTPMSRPIAAPQGAATPCAAGSYGAGQPSRLAPPSGPLGRPMAASSGTFLRAPATPGLRPPTTPSGLRPPATPSGMRPPATPSGMRPPATPSSMRPPATPGLRTPQGPMPSTPAQGSFPCGGTTLSLPTPQRSIRPPSAPAQTGLRTPAQGVCGIATPCAAGGRPPGTPQVSSQRGMSGIRPPGRPTGTQTPRPGASGLRPPGSGLRPPCGRPPEVSIEEQVQKDLLNKSALQPEKKVTAKSGRISGAIPQIVIDTPGGPERVIQQAVLERRVERDEEGERIIKNLSIIDVDQRTGQPKKIEMGLQQMDPKFAKEEGREVIGIISKVSITPSYTTVSQECTRATTEPLPESADMTVAEIAKLVDEEKEDVENTLKMLPPDLELSTGKIEMKKRLQNLRLNSESMALLEQSIIHPVPDADEAQAEPSPETMAAMMHTVEKGKNKEKSFQPITDEKSLWINANLERLVNIVGAEPVEVLDPANVADLETSGNLEQEMATGMEYYVDVDPVQYMSRIQLRGTQEPSYFPGYLVALPDFPEIIKLARSPDEVFASAWKSVQPKYFPDESMQSVVF